MSLRIAGDLLQVRIVSLSGPELEGRLFVHRSDGSRKRPGTLGDRLDEPGVDFLPITVGSARVEMVGLDGVAYLEHGGPLPEVAELRELGMPSHRAEITLHSGETVAGELFVTGPPERSRLSDLLNAPGRFILVVDGDRSFYVHRSAISRARSAEPGPRPVRGLDGVVQKAGGSGAPWVASDGGA